MRRPLVAVSCAVEHASWGVWHRDAVLLPYDYVAVLRDVGAEVVVVPAGAQSADVVDAVDALVLAGGTDVEAARYGEQPDRRHTIPQPERDATELLLLGAARRRDLPVLGICRGLQVMAVEAGGRLEQHLPDAVGHDGHRPAPGVYGRHGARFAPGSLAARLLGECSEVVSYHHQGVADPGRLVVTGWADDGSVESAEEPGRRFALGVQGHPEVDRDARVYAGLVAAARSPR